MNCAAQVVSAGKTYDMKVDALKPEGAVSVLDTDVEAEVAQSMENEAEVAAAEEAARQKLEAEAEEDLQRQAEATWKAAREQEALQDLERVSKHESWRWNGSLNRAGGRNLGLDDVRAG